MRMESRSTGDWRARMKMELQSSGEYKSRGFWLESRIFWQRRNSLQFAFNNNDCLFLSVSRNAIIFGVVHEAPWTLVHGITTAQKGEVIFNTLHKPVFPFFIFSIPPLASIAAAAIPCRDRHLFYFKKK